MDKNKMFIHTTDIKTADKLILLGFQLVNQDATSWTFLNDAKKNFNFEKFEKGKIVFNNMLCI